MVPSLVQEPESLFETPQMDPAGVASGSTNYYDEAGSNTCDNLDSTSPVQPVDDASGDWLFGRAKSRDDARTEESKADWLFERAKARRDAEIEVNDVSFEFLLCRMFVSIYYRSLVS